MSHQLLNSESGRRALVKLFEESPLLVEVRFRHVSSDWYLFDELSGMEAVMERIAPGVELNISSVFHLHNSKGALTLER